MTEWTHTIEWVDGGSEGACIVGTDHNGVDVFSFGTLQTSNVETRDNIKSMGATIRERHPLEGVKRGTPVMMWNNDKHPLDAVLRRFSVVKMHRGSLVVFVRENYHYDNGLTVEQYAEKYL